MHATPPPVSPTDAAEATAQLPMDGNRRRHKRLPYRTVVTLITRSESGFACVRCQSDDVSLEGARLVCTEPLSTRTLYLRFLMPELSEKFFEAEVVNQRAETDLRIGVGVRHLYFYGVRFQRLVSDPDLLATLRTVAGMSPGDA